MRSSSNAGETFGKVGSRKALCSQGAGPLGAATSSAGTVLLFPSLPVLAQGQRVASHLLYISFLKNNFFLKAFCFDGETWNCK